MAAANPESFDVWLRKTLVDLNSDDDVLGPYITGILDADDPEEEKEEVLLGILEGITDTGVEEICKKILNEWTKCHQHKEERDDDKPIIDVNTKLSQLMTNNTQTIVTTKTCTSEEKALKEAILAQYGQVSDEEDGENNRHGLQYNSNADAVARADKEKREKDKEEAQKKREKDREDRSKQKSKDEERKEKEKKRTQKGERRR